MELTNVLVTCSKFFMDYLLVPVCFLIVLLVQLKIIRDIRTQTGLVMFYGKQIEGNPEDVRRRRRSGSPPARHPAGRNRPVQRPEGIELPAQAGIGC